MEDERFLDFVVQWLHYQNDTGMDFQKPYIRVSLRHTFPLYVFLYGAIFVFGLIGNLGMLFVIVRRSLYKDPMYVFIANLALSDLFNIAVLPLTVANLVIQNWMIGSLLCFLLPMMHFLPIHASMATHMVMAVDRYRYIVHPIKSRMPAGLCVIGVWIVAVCTVLPYPLYIKYIDLGQVLGPLFEGIGICWFNTDRDMQQYNRAMFVLCFCLPLGVIASLFIKVSAEIKYALSDVTPFRIDYSRSTTQEGISYSRVTWLSRQGTTTVDDSTSAVTMYKAATASMRCPANNNNANENHSDHSEQDIDVAEETRIQHHLMAMIILFAACWFPIQILFIVSHFVVETSENSDHFDITYISLAFVGYLSTCVNSVIFISLRLKRDIKAKIQHYIPFASRRRLLGENTSSNYSDRKSPITEIDIEE